MAVYFQEQEIGRPNHVGGGGIWRLRNLTDITVLFGKNGAGKSHLLRNFRDMSPAGSHYTSPERSGDINSDMGLMQQEMDSGSRTGRRNTNQSAQFRQEVMSRIPALLMRMASIPGGTALSNAKEEILESLHLLLPEFNFRIVPENGTLQIARGATGEVVSSVNLLSSGEAEILALALDLLTICCMWQLDAALPTKVLLIDEPDTHLHPDLQQHLAEFLVRLVQKYEVQMVVSTHSTTLLSALGFYGQEETSVIYLNNTVEIQTAIPFDETLQELATCLGGHALMGPLFGAPILLVEGDDDYKIWSQVPRHGKVRFAVIPSNGDEIYSYQQALEKVFTSLRSTPGISGYALLDGDKIVPTPSATHPQDRVQYLGMVCHEAENLYLTNEILAALGYADWETACVRIRAEATNYGSIRTQLEACGEWNREQEDLKGLIGALSKILDPNGADWAIRVGKYLGTNRPSGQVGNFLGLGVVNALWGAVEDTEVAENLEVVANG
ncbi:MAG: AAA family ATPase [Candidatus Paceibacterota bacterium]